ncbi:MAG TPA: SRPBCC domain-containing protein [Chitinophagaceae bacterium]|jgi:activator of HSP90 ATPase|nr:SRPBCC domain-containing protein [Chitinophagaceae bacterium]
MPKTIIQKVVFKNIPAATLYNTYVNAKEHSASIGAPVKIQNKENTKFSADGNYITGKTFQLVKDKLIVQSWRAEDWNKSDLDSTFVLLFEQQGNDGIVNMVHANVPDKHFEDIKKGWGDFYWKPWKKYFTEKNISTTRKTKK